MPAERKSPAAGKDSGALKQRKERTRRRIRLMHRGRFLFLISCIYSIPDFQKNTNFCRIFRGRLPVADIQHPAGGTIFVSWYPEFCIPPAVFRTVISLYRRAKPPARHCTSFRLDRPAFSRPHYLLYIYRANLSLPFADSLSFRRLRRRQPLFRSHKQISKRISKNNSKNNSKNTPTEP